MAKISDEKELKVGSFGQRWINSLVECKACGANYNINCYDLDEKVKSKLLDKIVHRVRFQDFKLGLTSFDMAIEAIEQDEMPYIKPTSNKKPEKIGNIRI